MGDEKALPFYFIKHLSSSVLVWSILELFFIIYTFELQLSNILPTNKIVLVNSVIERLSLLEAGPEARYFETNSLLTLNCNFSTSKQVFQDQSKIIV